MRYLFRGLIRDSGRPVEGHVEAANEDAAYTALGGNGVVTESLLPDPKPLNLNDELPQSPEFADALESAFDSSSSQVDFDALTDRYKGKKVWVIDRDKIRRRVAQVVDAALALSAQRGEGAGMARERVANAIQGLFADTRNIASERNADSIAGMRFNGGGAAPAAPPPVNFASGNGGAAAAPASGGGGAGTAGHPGFENQLSRMAQMVKQAEAALAAITAAARSGGFGGGGRRGRFTAGGGKKGEEQNAVLLEIFKSNLALVRGLADPSAAGGAASGGAPAAAAAPDLPLEPAALEPAQAESAAPSALAVEAAGEEAGQESGPALESVASAADAMGEGSSDDAESVAGAS